MPNQDKKTYKRSNGEIVDIGTMETTHLSNSLAKAYRELFDSTNKNEYSRKLQVINDLKEELYKRFNKFYETLGDE